MKVKQKSIRVFEIECEDLPEFEAYLGKNAILLNGFLLLLKGDTKGAFAKECKKKGLCYATVGECDESTLVTKKDPLQVQSAPEVVEQPKVETPKEEPAKKAVPKPQVQPQPSLPIETPKTLIITKNLRSGESITTDVDVTILGRINSGAKVKTNANATILEAVDGDVEAWGDYLMIKTIGKGSVSFRGERIKKEELDGKMKLVTYDGKLILKDI